MLDEYSYAANVQLTPVLAAAGKLRTFCANNPAQQRSSTAKSVLPSLNYDFAFEKRLLLALPTAREKIGGSCAIRTLAGNEAWARAALLLEESRSWVQDVVSALIASTTGVMERRDRENISQEESLWRSRLLGEVERSLHEVRRLGNIRRLSLALLREAEQSLLREYEEEFAGWIIGLRMMFDDETDHLKSRYPTPPVAAVSKAPPAAALSISTPGTSGGSLYSATHELSVRSGAPSTSPAYRDPSAAVSTELLQRNHRLTSLPIHDLSPFLMSIDLSGNHIADISALPFQPMLERFMIGENKLTDSAAVARVVQRQCPELRHFGLLGNPCSPHGMSSEMHAKYRAFIVAAIPDLASLDTDSVMQHEREMAKRLFASYAPPKKVTSSAPAAAPTTGPSVVGSVAAAATTPLPTQPTTLSHRHIGLVSIPSALSPLLITLDLTGNQITDISALPFLGKLQRFMIGENKITDSGAVARVVQRQCPELRHFGLLGNPCSPHCMSSEMQAKYRAFIVAAIPGLVSLDDDTVMQHERDMGNRLFAAFAPISTQSRMPPIASSAPLVSAASGNGVGGANVLYYGGSTATAQPSSSGGGNGGVISSYGSYGSAPSTGGGAYAMPPSGLVSPSFSTATGGAANTRGGGYYGRSSV